MLLVVVEVEVEGVSQILERSVDGVLELVSVVVVFAGYIHQARSEPPVEELDVVVSGSGSAAGVEGLSHHYSEPVSFLMASTLATQAT